MRIPDEADAETRALLEWVADAKPPPLHAMSAAEARAAYNERRLRTELSPVEVARVEDRAIAGPAGPLALRLYSPRTSERLPILVYTHGGGFVIGDLESHDSVCRRLAVAGDCLVAAVDYRLAPEHPYPAAVEDALAALDWIGRHGGEIGGDTARLAVGGDSAGGALAGIAAQHARDAALTALRRQVLIYPRIEPVAETESRRAFADVFPIDRETIDWFNRHYLPDLSRMREPRAGPGLTRDLAGLAPALVLTAGLDPLCDEGERYAERLGEAGVPVAYHCDPGTIHGYLGMGKLLPHAERAIERIGSHLREAFADS